MHEHFTTAGLERSGDSRAVHIAKAIQSGAPTKCDCCKQVRAIGSVIEHKLSDKWASVTLCRSCTKTYRTVNGGAETRTARPATRAATVPRQAKPAPPQRRPTQGDRLAEARLRYERGRHARR